MLKKSNCVISLGGGAFLNNKIRRVVQNSGTSICLDWSHKTIINRIKKNNKRPISNLLNNDELENLILKRSKMSNT